MQCVCLMDIIFFSNRTRLVKLGSFKRSWPKRCCAHVHHKDPLVSQLFFTVPEMIYHVIYLGLHIILIMSITVFVSALAESVDDICYAFKMRVILC